MMPASWGPREIAWDCRHVLGDRPCLFHKQTGVVCTCSHYDRIDERILVIKLDGMGDVLRTTTLLPALAEVHPHAAIAWITRPESKPLLEGNRYLAEVIEYGPDAAVQLAVRRFDRVINLDAGRTGAALAATARAPRKDGFVLDERGVVQPTNAAARRWLEMGVFDDLKRQGRDTYQALMSDIVGTGGCPTAYVLELAQAELASGRRHLEQLGVDWSRPVIGLNTGAGGRWPLKRWREDGFLALVHLLAARQQAHLVLLGGPDERERHGRLRSRAGVTLVDPGCDHGVRFFAALVAACTLVITGDTLAMHLALALRRRAVVLFGPTNAAEVEMYGLGEKVLPDMTCLSCYKTACDFTPNCMDLITPEAVATAADRQLTAALAASSPVPSA